MVESSRASDVMKHERAMEGLAAIHERVIEMDVKPLHALATGVTFIRDSAPKLPVSILEQEGYVVKEPRSNVRVQSPKGSDKPEPPHPSPPDSQAMTA